jgi:transposase
MEEHSMPSPIPVPVRQAIFRRSEKGHSVSQIAAQCHLSERTVRHLLQQFREQGLEASQTRYRRGPQKTSSPRRALRQQVVSLRKEHPTWGAELLHVLLEDTQLPQAIPSARTLRRWLQGAGCQPAPRGRRPDADRKRGTSPHDVWQMDASEDIALKGGRRASWLRIVDESTGAVLGTWVFPPRPLESGSHSRGAGMPAIGL